MKTMKVFLPVTVENASVNLCRTEFRISVHLRQVVRILDDNGLVIEDEIRNSLCVLPHGVNENEFGEILRNNLSAKLYKVTSSCPILTKDERDYYEILCDIDDSKGEGLIREIASRQLVVAKDGLPLLYAGEKQYSVSYFSLEDRMDEDERDIADNYDLYNTEDDFKEYEIKLSGSIRRLKQNPIAPDVSTNKVFADLAIEKRCAAVVFLHYLAPINDEITSVQRESVYLMLLHFALSIGVAPKQVESSTVNCDFGCVIDNVAKFSNVQKDLLILMIYSVYKSVPVPATGMVLNFDLMEAVGISLY